MLRQELTEVLWPAWERIREHQYFEGLRKGWLPDAVLVRFCEQDLSYLLPAYGRALARCAAHTAAERHTAMLGHWVVGVLETRRSMASDFQRVARKLALPVSGSDAPPELTPATLNYTSFLAAASATSLASGLGAVLPSAMVHTMISSDLRERHTPGSRFTSWVEAAQPGDGYEQVVDALLGVVEEFAKECSVAEYESLLRNFRHGAYHEWAFVEGAWRLHDLPF